MGVHRYVGRALSWYFSARECVDRHVHDRRLGVHTAEELQPAELGVEAPGRGEYKASGWRDLSKILHPSEVTADDVFIDLGAGMGRIVLEAAMYPFARVIGIEVSERLTTIARENVERRRPYLRCRDVELITADVAEYDLPDDVTVAYMFNPFRGELFETVISGLLNSMDRHPRVLRLIYRTPLEDEVLERTGRFRLVKSARRMRPGREWSRASSLRMYVVAPSPTASVRGSRHAPGDG
jgi:16S rRNA G966 N2-methylase RsmD